MDGEKMTVEEVCLVLRGWRDSVSRLRIILRSPDVIFSAFCTVLDAKDGRAAFWIDAEESKNAVDFRLTGCVCGFRDARPGSADLPVNATVESMLGVVRKDFELLIMLLQCDNSPE